MQELAGSIIPVKPSQRPNIRAVLSPSNPEREVPWMVFKGRLRRSKAQPAARFQADDWSGKRQIRNLEPSVSTVWNAEG